MEELNPDILDKAFDDDPAAQREDWQKIWAAVGLIFRQTDEGTFDLLFIERAIHPDDAWSGHMAFPGGRREDGESILQTCQREVLEEVGLDLTKNTRVLGYLPGLRAYKHGQAQNFSLIPMGFLINEDQPLKLDPTEVGAAYWISLSWLLDNTNHDEFTYTVEMNEVILPCIPLKSNRIWGLTYKVLAEIQIRLEQMSLS